MHDFSEEDYAQQLSDLLPRGLAWDKSHDGVLMRLCRGLTGILHRLGVKALRVITHEQFPGTAEEYFDEWEKELGLPDECRNEKNTFDQRRYNIIAKYNESGGQDREYYKLIARSLGMEVEIEEFRPFRIGENTCGQPIQDDHWNFVWRVLWIPTRITEFKIGRDTMGIPLRSWTTNYALECIFNKLKPAHTHVIVAYLDPDKPEDVLLLKR